MRTRMGDSRLYGKKGSLEFVNKNTVAKIEVRPSAPGRFYHTVYSTACASAHFIVSSPFSGLLHRLGTVDSHLSYHTDT